MLKEKIEHSNLICKINNHSIHNDVALFKGKCIIENFFFSFSRLFATKTVNKIRNVWK